MKRVIDSFKDEYEIFSNFHLQPITLDGVEYPSNEHAFQAAKTFDQAVREKIRKATTCAKAKAMGKNRKLFTIRPDWEQVKNAVMEDLVYRKFRDNKVLRAELLATDDAELIEGNWWKDTIWGMVKDSSGKWVGENRLGKILMKVREQLHEKAMA
jgi:ribA/ribD-fused uncharacterized protein